MNRATLIETPGVSNSAPRRGGAALIVVMALLGTLAFLGLLFYSFAAQELASAQNFANAPPPTYPPTMFEDFALAQLLVGTPPSLTDSALYGSNWAVIPNMIGRPNAIGDRLVLADVNPFDGQGIGVWADPGRLGEGGFIFDYTGDGGADADETDFQINFSPAANNGVIGIGVDQFHPDAGYTYPDVNSLFLAFDGFVRDPNNPDQVFRVIIPSFHRPQYFPSMRFGDNVTFDTIFLMQDTQNKVLRPHAFHANAADESSSRFIDPINFPNGRQALSGDTTRVIPPFPFNVDIDLDGSTNVPGLWSPQGLANRNTLNPFDPSSTIYEFDVDNDGDGFRDSIWMDLDHPILDLPDGRQFVPMFAFKVIDADGLLNVNAHGNMNGYAPRQWNGEPISVFPGDLSNDLVSASNQGHSRAEINLGLGLTAEPFAGAPLGQHEANFGGSPTTVQELSNVELLMLLNGREHWRIDPNVGPVRESLIEGRWGEDDVIEDFYLWVRGEQQLAGAPSPGGYLLDDDGDSNMIGISPVFGQIPPRYPMTLPPGFIQDDDINAPVGHAGGGSAYRDPDLLGVWVPPFVHPLDYGGTGAGYLDASGIPGTPIVRRLAGRSGITSPARWPTYVDATTAPTTFWQYQYIGWDPSLSAPVAGSTNMVTNPYVEDASGEHRSLYGVRPYWQTLPRPGTPPQNELQLANAQHDFLRDEGSEVILDRRFRDPEYDAVFSAQEMEALHLSPSDFASIEATSRLRELAMINFHKANDQVRRQFTTDSWDRLDFGQGQSAGGTAARDWEFTLWNGTSSEFMTTTNNVAFPPEFSAATAGSSSDPLRPELRLLLKSEFGYNVHLNTNANAARYPRHRLNINRILSDDDPGGGTTAFDADENPRFRNLTPHPDIAALNIANGDGWGEGTLTIPNMIHANDAAPLAAFNDLGTAPDGGTSLAIAQEWWARYDRQRLARDIYTLLWVLGGGEDDQNYTNTSALYTEEQTREMAQFAVNYVDALDRDDVITRFEYDNDLTNGWDDPSQVVSGVEAQQLVFSEWLWVETTELNEDNTATKWDDQDETHSFLYIELRNTTPFDVEMRDESWRIVRRDPDIDDPSTNIQASFRFTTHESNVVKAGQTFIIACQGDTVLTEDGEVASSDFYVNFDTSNDMPPLAKFEAVVPYRVHEDDPDDLLPPSITEDDHPDPLADIDLSYRNGTTQSLQHTDRFEWEQQLAIDPLPPTGPGTLVQPDHDSSVTQGFVLTLERRRNLRTDGVVDDSNDEWANDWVEVDRVTVPKSTFNPTGTLVTQLEEIKSRARREVLVRSDEVDGTGTSPRNHTIGNPGDPNDAANFPIFDARPAAKDDPHNSTNLMSIDRNQGNNEYGPFTIWQPHFDRDFSSVFELLSVPVIAPNEVTERLVDATSKKLTGWYDETTDPKQPVLAGVRFMNPDGTTPAVTTDDNRWYRLFEFVTIPDGGEDAIRDRLERLVRTPGKINLNTIRDEAVLAAILDDAHIKRFAAAPYADGSLPTTEDTIQHAARNWFRELILARDGLDPVSREISLPGVPGVPSTESQTQWGSVPFRSMSYVAPIVDTWSPDANANKTAHNLLREHVTHNPTFLPNRLDGLDELGLFEARPSTDVGSDAVDYHTRNRLLAKVANHTTTRSNVFAVWLTVGFFEAHHAPGNPNVVQIGGEMAGMPRHRAFIVVDRTRLEDAVEVDSNGVMTLNWRTFLLHRRELPGQ